MVYLSLLNFIIVAMIDKIVFYILDVDVDKVERNLWRYGAIEEELDLVGLDKKRGLSKWGATLNNAISISMQLAKDGTYRLKGHGSLHKFAMGNNFSLFTINESKKAISQLGLLLGISLDRFIITNMEFAVNLQMDKDPIKYIDTITKYRVYPFIYMKSLYKSSKIKGKVCKLTDYEIKFYDKTFEATHRNKLTKEDVPKNILRYEIAYSRKKLIQSGLKNISAEKLFLEKSLFYHKLKKELQETLDNITFEDINIDYSKEISDELIKDYIFGLSAKYVLYLNHIKKKHGNLAYKREKAKKKKLDEQMKEYIIEKHVLELKSKFAHTLKLISARK